MKELVDKADISICEEGLIEAEQARVGKEKQDDAFDFAGDSTLPAPPELTAEEERRLYRKIDMRILPILTLMYLCSHMDRGKWLFGNLET